MSIIIGLGSGRCGSTSLSVLLSEQKNINITHELIRLPWIINKKRFNKCMDQIGDGDIAFYYLNYVDLIIERFKDVKFICLKRDKTQIINSLLKKTRGRDHWNPNPKDDYIWYECFPKYNVSKKQAVKLYVEDYYKQCYILQNKYPNLFKIFNLEDLNSKNGQNKIFKFLDIPDEDMIFNTNIKLN